MNREDCGNIGGSLYALTSLLNESFSKKSYKIFRNDYDPSDPNSRMADDYIADMDPEDIGEDPEGTGRYEDIDKVYRQYKKDMSDNPRKVSKATNATLQGLNGAVDAYERKCILEKNIDPDNSYAGSTVKAMRSWLRRTTRKYKNLTVIR